MARSLGFVIGAAALAALGVGCGGGEKLAPVSGTVTYQNKPVANASLTFIPEKGPQAYAITDANGKFTAETKGKPGVVVGSFKVTIIKGPDALPQGAGMPSASPPSSPPSAGDAAKRSEMAKLMEARAKKGQSTASKPPFPAKYSDARTTDLKFTIDSSGNESLKIELKD